MAGTHKNADKPGGLASKENYHKAMVRALDSGKKTVRCQSTLLLSSSHTGLREWYAWQGLEAAQLDEDEKLCLQRGTLPTLRLPQPQEPEGLTHCVVRGAATAYLQEPSDDGTGKWFTLLFKPL